MKIQLTGKVFTGKGEGKQYVERPWVQHEIETKLGFTPYAGTLNLSLTPESAKQRKAIEKFADLRVCATHGCCGGILFKAQIDKMDCGVVIPELEEYPPDVLEVIAYAYLREKLGLRDGDEVAVMVTV
jgi:riboflavin kinase